jgi:flagellar basal body rod protein FlgC
MTVRELLQRVDSRELTEWMAFYKLEPWGAEIEDYRTGVVASTIANANRDSKRKSKPFQPKDFMPQQKVEEQSWEEQEKILQRWSKVWDKSFE